MEPAEVFRANLALIGRALARVVRRARLSDADAEDFESAVKLHLIDNDYAVLRAFEGRCSLETYVTIVAQRFLTNERIRAWGRWSESAAAKRMGEVALLLERLVRRDGRTLDEALPLLRDVARDLTRADAEAMLAEIPERRAMRPRAVDASAVEARLVAPDEAQDRVVSGEIRDDSARASQAMRDALAALPLEERMLVRMRFESNLAVSEIARAMQVEQRPLYRQLERVLRKLREALAGAGIDARTAAGLIGSKLAEMDFGLRAVESGAPLLSIDEEPSRDQEKT
jgi:RNA polymerase sigma factor (sigma-70 family)